MQPRFILDTDTIVDLIRGNRAVRARLESHSPETLAISAITVSELRYGAIASRHPQKAMGDSAALIHELRVVPFGASAGLLHAEIRLALKNQPLGPNDMIVAATTLAVPAVLVSSNLREYSRVPNLQVESWR